MASNALTLPAAMAGIPRLPTPKVTNPSILALDLGTTTGWALSTTGFITSGTASFVYFEEVRRHIGTDAAHIYGGFLACLTAWCEERDIAYQGVPVGTIKRFITGKGNADKGAVIEAVRQRGHTPTDDNEADAIAILLWATETKGGVI